KHGYHDREELKKIMAIKYKTKACHQTEVDGFNIPVGLEQPLIPNLEAQFLQIDEKNAPFYTYEFD
ncbi:unnamed protein product, partial [Ilex paraguariensis]